MKILFDTNIIIDVLQDRKPWNEDSKKLFLAVADEKIDGYVTAKELCDIWYLAKQIHKGEENAQRMAQNYISKLSHLFNILDISSEDIITAMSYEHGDFEDAVMMATAERTNMDCIVTRNIKDYAVPFASFSLKSPEELVKKLIQ
ncbi:MAG: PIN domain-containing protein [Eubacterium sp.]|nr:PIN domain-containing protein [Eubacterium sp.]